MKKIMCILLGIVLLVVFTLPVFAVGEVPGDVLRQIDSVVRILAEYKDEFVTGSGFVIKCDKTETLIATNYHVVEGDPYGIFVWISNNEKISASILHYSDQKDLCILKLSSPIDAKPVSLADTVIKQGEAVYAVGFPGAADGLSDYEAHASSDATITDGIVSALREVTVSNYGSPVKILQINAAINHGNSGGPLFNKNGEVVGINTYGIDDAQGIFGAIQIGELKSFLADKGIVLVAQDGCSDVLWILIVIAILVVAGAVLAVGRKYKKISAKRKVESMTLRHFMQNHPEGIGEEEAVAMLLPVALQLRDLHNNGGAHLEVSADTVMVSKSGASLNNASGMESARYSSGFAAPEIYRNQSAGNQSDIYSFCAALAYAATGVLPENALTKKNTDVAETPSGTFQRIIFQGMTQEAECRFESMQNLILKLSPFNTKPFTAFLKQPPVDSEEPLPVEVDEKSKDANVESEGIVLFHKKVKLKVLLFACVAAFILIFATTYVGCYFHACALAEDGSFSEADTFLFIRSLTKIHDPKICAYIDAGLELDARQYEAAKTGFDALSGYRNANEMALEADYRYALKLAEANRFEEALSVFARLKEQGGRYSAEKELDIKYRWGIYNLYDEINYEKATDIFAELKLVEYKDSEALWCDAVYNHAVQLLEQGDEIGAYKKMALIKGYSDADDLLKSLGEQVYARGQKLYRERRYEEAFDVFTAVFPHKKSGDYLCLIFERIQRTLHDYEGDGYWVPVSERMAANMETLSVKRWTIKDMINAIDFEDVKELIQDSIDDLSAFMEGTWKSNDGKYYLHVDGYGNITSNLPYLQHGMVYKIEEHGTYPVIFENPGNPHSEYYNIILQNKDSVKLSRSDRTLGIINGKIEWIEGTVAFLFRK